METTELHARLMELLSDGDQRWAQGIELARTLGITTDQMLTLMGLEIELVSIPAGTGRLGANSDVEVEVEAFEMAQTPTTRRQYAALMFAQHDGDRWVRARPPETTDPDHPVAYVSAYDAEEFCRRLSDVLGLDGDGEVHARLPLSAEWEYAAKAGQDFEYPGSDDPDEVAWHAGNSGHQTHPVGLKKPNAWGLYDMPGNVYEWCSDNWIPSDSPGAAAYRAHREAGLSRVEWDRRAAERQASGE